MTTPTATAVTAFCPGHISGYFRRIAGETPMTTGSTGAGIVISEGVTATVRHSDAVSITIIREHQDGSVREHVSGSDLLASSLEKLHVTADVITRCRLPIGAGFGLSASALLATLSALNRLHGLGLSPREIAGLAHEAEVIHRTGLGDVAACQAGGMVIRRTQGIDGEIERWFSVPEPLYAVSWGPIPTPSVLSSSEQLQRVSAAYPGRVPGNPRDFFALCREFDEASGLLTPEVARAFGKCDKAGISSAMTMLGNGIVACGPGAREVLSSLGEVYEFGVARSGPVLISEER